MRLKGKGYRQNPIMQFIWRVTALKDVYERGEAY